MNNKDLLIIRGVIRKYYRSLDRNEARAWAVKSGRFLNQNSKLAKGDNYNIGLELAPAKLVSEKHDMCGKATTCLATCVFFAGKSNTIYKRELTDKRVITPVMACRVRRTWLYINDHKFFMELLNAEIDRAKKISDALDIKLGVRLNVFSDLDWREFIYDRPDIQFYDYTKHWNLTGLRNYSITYSHNEKITTGQVTAHLFVGQNVSIVFPNGIPKTWHGHEVINGDLSDCRYEDKKGVIVGLSLKKPLGSKSKITKFLKLGQEA